MSTDGGPRRLYREPRDRKLAGVCAGIGDYFGIDPTMVRLAVIVLTLATAFTGVILYLLAAIVVPERPGNVPRVRPDRPLLPEGSNTPIMLCLLAVAGLAIVRGGFGFEAPFVAVGFILLGAWLLVRDQDDQRATANITQSGPLGTSGATTVATEAAPERGIPSQSDHTLDAAGDTAQDDDHATRIPSFVPDDSALRAGSQGEVPPPVPPWELGSPIVERNYTPAVLCLVAGVVTLLTVLDIISLNFTTAAGGALLVVGALMIVGAWRGRTRWLAFVGAVGVCLLVLDESMGVPLDAGIGERTVVVDDPREGGDTRNQELAIGELELDLREVDDDVDRPVRIRGELGIGELIVIIPDDMTADIDAHVQFGSIEEPGEGDHDGGVDVERSFTLERDPDTPEGEGRRVELDLEVGMGQVTIRHG